MCQVFRQYFTFLEMYAPKKPRLSAEMKQKMRNVLNDSFEIEAESLQRIQRDIFTQTDTINEESLNTGYKNVSTQTEKTNRKGQDLGPKLLTMKAHFQNAKAVVQKLQGKIDEQAITIQSQESQLAWKTRMNSKAGTLQTCTKMKKNREKEITGKSYTEICTEIKR